MLGISLNCLVGILTAEGMKRTIKIHCLGATSNSLALLPPLSEQSLPSRSLFRSLRGVRFLRLRLARRALTIDRISFRIPFLDRDPDRIQFDNRR